MNRPISLLFLLATTVIAADAPPIVTFRPPPSVVLPAGKSVQVHLPVSVAAGYHVQANPPSEDYLIATTLTIAGGDGITVGEPVYPQPKKFRLEGTTDELATYEGAIEIILPLKATLSASPGPRTLKGTLRYQACDARSCFAPKSLPVEIAVAITAGRPTGAQQSQKSK